MCPLAICMWKKITFLKSSTVWNWSCFQVNESIVSLSTDPRSHLLHYFLDTSIVNAILGIAAKPNDTVFWPPWTWQSRSIHFLMFRNWALRADPDSTQITCTNQSRQACVQRGVFIIRLVGFHCLGFLTSFKEIIAWKKKAWERVQLMTAWVQVGLSNPPRGGPISLGCFPLLLLIRVQSWHKEEASIRASQPPTAV